MKNSIQEGMTLSLPAPAGGVVAGRVYVFGDIVSVAVSTAAAGLVTTFETTPSVYEFTKVNGEAWTLGAKLYWDAVNFRMTTTAAGNTLVGNAAAAALAAAATGRVKMRPLAG